MQAVLEETLADKRRLEALQFFSQPEIKSRIYPSEHELAARLHAVLAADDFARPLTGDSRVALLAAVINARPEHRLREEQLKAVDLRVLPGGTLPADPSLAEEAQDELLNMTPLGAGIVAAKKKEG